MSFACGFLYGFAAAFVAIFVAGEMRVRRIVARLAAEARDTQDAELAAWSRRGGRLSNLPGVAESNGADRDGLVNRGRAGGRTRSGKSREARR